MTKTFYSLQNSLYTIVILHVDILYMYYIKIIISLV